MNEETTINGIDCSWFEDCIYFKQLKRLEQREKALTELADDLQKRNHDLTLTNEQLEQENKRLQMLSCANCGEKYLSPDGAELYDKNVQLQKENEELKTYIQKMDKPEIKTIDSEIALKNIELQQENEELKENVEILQNQIIQEHEQYNNLTHDSIDDLKLIRKYEQALEEIKKEANRLLYEENPIYGYNNSNYFEILAKYVLVKTEEVLND